MDLECLSWNDITIIGFWFNDETIIIPKTNIIRGSGYIWFRVGVICWIFLYFQNFFLARPSNVSTISLNIQNIDNSKISFPTKIFTGVLN